MKDIINKLNDVVNNSKNQLKILFVSDTYIWGRNMMDIIFSDLEQISILSGKKGNCHCIASTVSDIDSSIANSENYIFVINSKVYARLNNILRKTENIYII